MMPFNLYIFLAIIVFISSKKDYINIFHINTYIDIEKYLIFK